MSSRWELIGDVNNDGKIDRFDALLIFAHTLKTIELNEDEQSRANVSLTNEAVNAVDARAVLRHLAGVELITQMQEVFD